jgi:hypothetical protein
LRSGFIADEDHAEEKELKRVFATAARRFGQECLRVKAVAIEEWRGAAFNVG